MLRSFRIGKVFGIPLYIHTTFLLLPAWMLLTNYRSGPANVLFALALLAAVFGCVVLHELGHALMARVFGIGTESITLYPIGGVARLRRMSEKPGEELCIALAGPAVNLILAALLAPVVLLALLSAAPPGDALFSPELGLMATAGQFVLLLCVSNLFMLGFNLLPCFPMDGGRVLRALLSLGLGQLRATEIAAAVGFGMAFLIATLSVVLPVIQHTTVSPWPMVLAMFVLLAGRLELWGVRQLHARRRAAQLAPIIPQPELVPVPVRPLDAEAPQSVPDVPFTGVAWDGRRRVWVRWHNGHPVAFWG